MSDIAKDIAEDIQIKPNQSKIVLKWVVRIAIALISAAFVYGQLKATRLNERANMRESLNENTQAIIELRNEVKFGFDNVNKRIDKVYDDGYKTFNDYQQYNNKILGMILDYGKSDKDMLKRMLDVMTTEKSKEIQNQLEQAKTESKKDSISIIVKPINKK